MTDRNQQIAARFDVAIAKFGLRATHPGRPLTSDEYEAADWAVNRILADRDFAGLATARDMDRAGDTYHEPKDY